jgi:hypothetical protein
MAKIDVTQTINDFNGNPQKYGLSYETIEYLGKLLDKISKLIPKEKHDDFVNSVENEFMIKTLRDVIIGSLIVGDQNDSIDQKIQDYKLLQMVSTQDDPDLGETERLRIMGKIGKVYNHIVIIGRSKELLKIKD